jgi:hypothetical protein
MGIVGKVAARATLAELSEDRLYFAGETVSTNALSSLHGAYLTGQNAVTSIFENLSGVLGPQGRKRSSA